MCLTFWSTVNSYKKAINLDQNKLFLNTKIRKHCASTKCLNGSQIFELGTAITLGVYLGPPCRLVCKLVIENSVWHWGGAGRLQPQALADPPSPGVAARCQSPFTPVSRLGCLENLAPSQQPLSPWRCWGASSHVYFCFEASELQVKPKKQWLRNWWLGSHNCFTSDLCCRLWASVSVTGK